MPNKAAHEPADASEPLDAMGEAWTALESANNALISTGVVGSVELTRTAMPCRRPPALSR